MEAAVPSKDSPCQAALRRGRRHRLPELPPCAHGPKHHTTAAAPPIARGMGSELAMAGRTLKSLPRCGAWARTRRHACQAKVVPGRARCRFHGGLSTGPRTAEGKAKVAAARSAGSRAAWAQWRSQVGLPPGWRYYPARISAERYIAEHGPWRPDAPVDGEPCTKTLQK